MRSLLLCGALVLAGCGGETTEPAPQEPATEIESMEETVETPAEEAAVEETPSVETVSLSGKPLLLL